MKLVLASTSVYRKELLSRLGLSFVTVSPKCDESSLADETAEQLVARLAQLKALSVTQQFPDSIIIGSDQVASLDGMLLTKPGNHANATRQLEQASGRKVVFYTGLCVMNTTNFESWVKVCPYTVYFRKLSSAQIEAYLERETPYDCAGSFKSEGLGVALFEKMEGDDPSSLIGLPMIALVGLLEQAGLSVLT